MDSSSNLIAVKYNVADVREKLICGGIFGIVPLVSDDCFKVVLGEILLQLNEASLQFCFRADGHSVESLCSLHRGGSGERVVSLPRLCVV